MKRRSPFEGNCYDREDAMPSALFVEILEAALERGSSREGFCCSQQHVVVVGGGNSAGQAAMHLADHARKVTMIVRNRALSATLSRYLVDRIFANTNIEVRYECAVTKLDDNGPLHRVEVIDNKTGKPEWIDTRKLFICISGVSNAEWAKDTAINCDGAGDLVTGPDLLDQGKPAEY